MVEFIQQAEDLGLDEIWLGDEGPARDPLAAAKSTHGQFYRFAHRLLHHNRRRQRDQARNTDVCKVAVRNSTTHSRTDLRKTKYVQRAACCDCYVFFPIHLERYGRSVNGPTHLEVPQRLAASRIQSNKISFCIAGEHKTTRR